MSTTELTPEQQQKLLATGTLFHALAADPRYRKEVLGIIKKAAPDTMIPELDLQDSLLKSVDERLKPKDETMSKLNERFDSLEKRLTREDWREANNLSQEECLEVEDLAKKEQIGNSSAALELWKSRQAAGTPRGTRRNIPGTGEYLKKLSSISPRDSKNLRLVAEEEATRILSTIKRAS